MKPATTVVKAALENSEPESEDLKVALEDISSALKDRNHFRPGLCPHKTEWQRIRFRTVYNFIVRADTNNG